MATVDAVMALGDSVSFSVEPVLGGQSAGGRVPYSGQPSVHGKPHNVSLGLPAHLAPDAVRRSFVSAQHTVAFTLLTISVLIGLIFQGAQPSSTLWPSVIALVPALGLLLVVGRVGVNRRGVVVWSLAYLIVGGLGVHMFALGMFIQPIRVQSSDGFSFLAVKVALILVGGVVIGIGAGIVGATAGYLVGELAVGLAKVETALPLEFDIPTFVTFVLIVLIIALIGINSLRQVWVLPHLQRAAHAEHLASLRYRVEVRAAALMHDTVLNHLGAIAESGADALNASLRNQIEQDVESLTGEEWLADAAEDSAITNRSARSDWQHSGLFAAVREARVQGLAVTATGDLAAVSKLNREASTALGLAVKQCLVNVLKHSGVREAEVAVYRSNAEVSVMVVDGGCGFVERATGADRLGLRSSVRKRMELVGGTVNVWSAPGRGTSIMIKVPVEPTVASSSADAEVKTQ